MINMMGAGLVWPILPSLVAELTGGSISRTAAIYGATAVVFSLMQFLFAPIMGALSDRYGRRPIMLLALIALGLDNILMAFAPTIGWMFFARAMGGIFGATTSIANAYIADTMDAKDRATGFGMIGAAFGVGFIVGPVLGGYWVAMIYDCLFIAQPDFHLPTLYLGYFFLQETLPP
ncbi:Tetracycline resistance protein, class C [Nymphon striatum]|nr:Tetracycline resistance protein, class C [Nymphon striatum]